jgi:hypothetical protein
MYWSGVPLIQIKSDFSRRFALTSDEMIDQGHPTSGFWPSAEMPSS